MYLFYTPLSDYVRQPSERKKKTAAVGGKAFWIPLQAQYHCKKMQQPNSC